MDREAALRTLRLGTASERLSAVRFLVEGMQPQDVAVLRAVRRREPDAYVSVALDAALRQATHECTEEEQVEGIDEQQARDDTYAQAVEHTTQMVVHELGRFVGLVRIAARSEVPDFDSSETRRELERLSSLMDAVERLGRAAATPSFEDFDLAGMLLDLRARELERFGIEIEYVGVEMLLVVGDPGLIELAARNGLVNACESIASLPTDGQEPIVMVWGVTDRDAYVAVLDRGPGLPEDLADPFAFAQSRKPEHLGVGLALAERALRSLGGRIELENRAGGGVQYEVRWPLPGT